MTVSTSRAARQQRIVEILASTPVRSQTELLDHLATGATNEQIAGTLFLSQATVRTHVQNILTKLQVHSRLEAIALVHETGPRR